MKKKNLPHPAHYVPWDEDLARDLRDPEFKRMFEAEKLKLEVSLMLIELRKKKKLTQQALAKKLGTSQSAIARIEAGKLNVTIETLGKMAATMQASVKISLIPS